MPHQVGRTGKPGNTKTYHPMHIRTAHPDKLALQEGQKPVLGGWTPEGGERVEGRSDRPGNNESYEPIHIRTPEPAKLSPQGGPAVVASPAAVLATKDVPSRTKKYGR